MNVSSWNRGAGRAESGAYLPIWANVGTRGSAVSWLSGERRESPVALRSLVSSSGPLGFVLAYCREALLCLSPPDSIRVADPLLSSFRFSHPLPFVLSHSLPSFTPSPSLVPLVPSNSSEPAPLPPVPRFRASGLSIAKSIPAPSGRSFLTSTAFSLSL